MTALGLQASCDPHKHLAQQPARGSHWVLTSCGYHDPSPLCSLLSPLPVASVPDMATLPDTLSPPGPWPALTQGHSESPVNPAVGKHMQHHADLQAPLLQVRECPHCCPAGAEGRQAIGEGLACWALQLPAPLSFPLEYGDQQFDTFNSEPASFRVWASESLCKNSR